MTLEQLAKHYVNYWYISSDDRPKLSDNAPPELARFVLGFPDTQDRSYVYDALREAAQRGTTQELTVAQLLRWLDADPRAVSVCDAYLGAVKTSPGSLHKLLAEARRRQTKALQDKVYRFLFDQLNQ